MNPLAAAQSTDALLRGPVQGRASADMGFVADDRGSSDSSGGGIGAQRSESLKTVSENKIDPPSTGGKMEQPDEGLAESGMSAIAILLQKFADAQDIAK